MKTISTLSLPARIENLGAFIAGVTEAAKATGFNPRKIFDIELALEEVLVNIINYAYQGKTGDIELSCKSDNKEWFIMEIADTGSPFDVLSVPPPDLTADIDERKIGGLGIFFMKKLVDDVKYRREGERNVLELKMRLNS
ncbi:MAG: serine-protein kinase RsbW [Syntrophorhabdaceae bacterium PtaU1.Bin034]|jgi:anti-sigma regulatory factor (Ser/Thr protein kinase)|nr:MAG: serine-protein kinase RsbW [Syntrophorhabdaceae bacterium PtaU1.Bin034]